jgi:hypothetical protein
MIDVLVETKRIEKNLDAKQTVLVRIFYLIFSICKLFFLYLISFKV